MALLNAMSCLWLRPQHILGKLLSRHEWPSEAAAAKGETRSPVDAGLRHEIGRHLLGSVEVGPDQGWPVVEAGAWLDHGTVAAHGRVIGAARPSGPRAVIDDEALALGERWRDETEARREGEGDNSGHGTRPFPL